MIIDLYDYRLRLLSQPAVDITPTNADSKFIWSKTDNLDAFEEEWSMKPVTIKGMFDHTKEI